MNRRRFWIRTCKQHGLHVEPATLKAMIRYEMEIGQDTSVRHEGEGRVKQVLTLVKQKLTRSPPPKVISLQLWEQSIEEMNIMEKDMDSKNGTTLVRRNTTRNGISTKQRPASSSSSMSSSLIPSNGSCWKLVQAFETPTFVYDSLRQQFRQLHQQKHCSLLGSAKEKFNMTTQRYWHVQQRVVRQLSHVNLITTDRLLGSTTGRARFGTGRSKKPCMLLGLLHRADPTNENPNVALELEDISGTVPLQLTSSVQLDPVALYCENGMVLVEGHHDNGVLQVNRMGLPPLESREESLHYFPPPSPSTINAHQLSVTDVNSLVIYSMSNITLDDADVVLRLEELLGRIKRESFDNPDNETLLVLMGNFTTETLSLSVALDELARIIEKSLLSDDNDDENTQQQRRKQHNHLRSSPTILILPGPNDTPSSCWPLPPLKSSSLQSLPNVRFVTNPCRLQVIKPQQQQQRRRRTSKLQQQQKTIQEVLFFRHDLIRQYLQHQVLSPTLLNCSGNKNKAAAMDDDDDEETLSPPPLSQRVVQTMLCQGHMSPQSPIYWNYDAAMNLYPLPDVFVVGMDDNEAFQYSIASASSFGGGDDHHDNDTGTKQCHVVAPGKADWAKVTMDITAAAAVAATTTTSPPSQGSSQQSKSSTATTFAEMSQSTTIHIGFSQDMNDDDDDDHVLVDDM